MAMVHASGTSGQFAASINDTNKQFVAVEL
jgi:hypothetical protein